MVTFTRYASGFVPMRSEERENNDAKLFPFLRFSTGSRNIAAESRRG